MGKELLVYGSPAIENAEIEEVVAVMQSGWLGTGPRVARFERDFAEYKGTEYAVALNSCTATLHLSILAAGIGPGDVAALASEQEVRNFLSKVRESIEEPRNAREHLEGIYGCELTELFFGRYTKKMWGQDLSDMPISVVASTAPTPIISMINTR